MSETPKPSQPIRRKPLPTEAAATGTPKPVVARPAVAKTAVAEPAVAKPTAAKPAATNGKVLRPKVRPAAEVASDDDEFAMAPARRLPPVVMGKKKKPKKKSAMSPEEREYEAGAEPKPRSEYLIPLILIGVGLIANVLVSLMLRMEGVSLGIWIGIRMGIIVISMAITYGALFICAAVLDADYGYLDVGAVKVAAICLTQGWVGDLAGEIPVPLIGNVIAFLVSYAMFKCFFELGEMEIIYSMIIVRIVHVLAMIFVFVAVLTAVMGGKLPVPLLEGAADAILAPEDDADFEDPAGAKDMDEPEGLEP